MPTDTTHDQLDAETASLIQEQLAALVAKSRRGVSEPEATKAYCHCNTEGCERCEKQVLAATQEVARRHAEFYPEIAAAMDAARYGHPGPAVRELMHKQGAAIAELTSSLADLKRMLADATGTAPEADDETPEHELHPKGSSK